MPDTSNIKGILFDLDGVLYIGSDVIRGAIDAIATLRACGYICRFVTNTSTLSMRALQSKLHKLGFDIPSGEIISAPQATILYLNSFADTCCRLLLAEDVKQDFAGFLQSDDKPNYVVIGDIGDAWSYPLLNSVFSNLMQGAKLIAIHKNRFWQTEHGLKMDIGGFIEALEYASGTLAMIIGKPSPDFFNIAVADMGLAASEVMMLGDDIDSDIGGAQGAGLFGVLVRTGKFRQAYCDASSIKPDAILDSIKELPQMLGVN